MELIVVSGNKESDMATNAKRPVHEVRLGRIKAAIWENQAQGIVRHNVTIQRIYKDADDQWQTSESFGRDDLPLVAKVADLAHSWIFHQVQEVANQEATAQEGF